jgi:hypothetical protein
MYWWISQSPYFIAIQEDLKIIEIMFTRKLYVYMSICYLVSTVSPGPASKFSKNLSKLKCPVDVSFRQTPKQCIRTKALCSNVHGLRGQLKDLVYCEISYSGVKI